MDFEARRKKEKALTEPGIACAFTLRCELEVKIKIEKGEMGNGIFIQV